MPEITYAHFAQVHRDRLDQVGRDRLSRQLLAQARARRRLARAERQAQRARLILTAPAPSAARMVQRPV